MFWLWTLNAIGYGLGALCLLFLVALFYNGYCLLTRQPEVPGAPSHDVRLIWSLIFLFGYFDLWLLVFSALAGL